MHFEILVEDQSGKKALNILVPKIIGEAHTFNIHAYKGIGRIPKNINRKTDAKKRILLDQLPRLMRGYGKTFANYPADYPAAVIVVCDLDGNCLEGFHRELVELLEESKPKPETRFCFAIEEGEAWLLGDIQAVKAAYPRARKSILNSYTNDAVCGTWEWLANAVYVGGAAALIAQGWQAVGAEKSRWAEAISPHIDVSDNRSPSFGYFRDCLLELAGP